MAVDNMKVNSIFTHHELRNIYMLLVLLCHKPSFSYPPHLKTPDDYRAFISGFFYHNSDLRL